MIHKLTFSEFFGLIGDSINFGKKFFLVVTGGVLNIDFKAILQCPIVNGIEVVKR